VYKCFVVLLVVVTTYSQAEEVVNRDPTIKNKIGLVEVSDAELKLVSGQTGSTEQLQQNIDQKSESPLGYQPQTEHQANYVEPPKVTSYFNGTKL